MESQCLKEEFANITLKFVFVMFMSPEMSDKDYTDLYLSEVCHQRIAMSQIRNPVVTV